MVRLLIFISFKNNYQTWIAHSKKQLQYYFPIKITLTNFLPLKNRPLNENQTTLFKVAVYFGINTTRPFRKIIYLSSKSQIHPKIVIIIIIIPHGKVQDELLRKTKNEQTRPIPNKKDQDQYEDYYSLDLDITLLIITQLPSQLFLESNIFFYYLFLSTILRFTAISACAAHKIFI